MIYADIVFFALVAAFIFFKLHSAFGQEDGTEQRAREKLAKRAEKAACARDAKVVEPEDTSAADEAAAEGVDGKLAEKVAKIRAIDSSFTVPDFMMGATAAFEMILEAYSNGNRALLKDLLAADVYEAFDEAFKEAESAGEYEHITLVAIDHSHITNIVVRGNKAKITVHFDTEQIRVLRDKDGNELDEAPGNVELLDDEWTFERDLKSSNPNWTVIDT